MENPGRLVLERLMRYHRFLTEGRGRAAPPKVTSAEIARALDIDPTQVRKDLGSIGVRGTGRVGFDAEDVVQAVRKVLSFDETHPAILVGAGHLGGALTAYAGFARYGLLIRAAFDNDREKTGHSIACCAVRHTRGMRAFIRKEGIRLAILTVPASAAQDVTNRLVDAGIKAIWNFSPTHLAVPPDVFVRNEHISLGLAELTFRLGPGT